MPSLTDADRKKCRPKVDLVHKLMSERSIEVGQFGKVNQRYPRTFRIFGLGRKCLDLFLIEQDYLSRAYNLSGKRHS